MSNKYNISIDTKTELEFNDIINLGKVKKFLDFICDYLKIKNCEISVIFSDSNTIKTLNNQYRNINEPTDVLSFPFEGDDFIVGIKHLRYLGDIIICPKICNQNALDYSEEPEKELLRLIVHGVLHLYGYDHNTNQATEPMIILQEKILLSFIN